MRVFIALEIKQVNHSRSTIPKLERRIFTDVPRSAARKAGRGMPTLVYFFSVSKTTFRDIFLELQRHGLSKLALTFTGISLKFLKQRMIKLLEGKKLEFLARRFLVLLPGVVQHWFLLLLEQGLVQPYFPLPLVSGLAITNSARNNLDSTDSEERERMKKKHNIALV
ncbi:unnamed protein product [Camellia sinensis]